MVTYSMLRFLLKYRKLIYENISDDIMILPMKEKPCVHRKMFCKLHVRRESIVTNLTVRLS